ncbi:hypothetical protein A8709_02715 [Paenibacillus pectinilyticus]|uniref:F5/8 type C domain-containing protein n=1 Tax=Paenibacillus pectinilyticus TaxID=512399 RepID=A0A1C1A719_9BACL|nr:chitobiase/beta-hexosaminidase C-terminal domain-containing protein [Paenibacillus pectinilyticus]OCT16361.1 hypothetical protein A8709_02715 [Paenibacillus pectinilyticus]
MFTLGKRGLLASFIFICLWLVVPFSSKADPAPPIPQIVSVTSLNGNGAYNAGKEIAIRVTYDTAMTVTGVPSIALNSGGIANYTSGSGTDTLIFTYIPQTGQNTTNLDWVSSNALTLNGGSIYQAEDGTNANLSTELPALSAHSNIEIDTVAPQAPVITLSTTDPVGQVTVTITYSSDTVDKRYQMWGDNPSEYTNPFVLTSTRTISAYATDAAGNSSSSEPMIVNIDTSPPAVRAAIVGGVQRTYDNEVRLAIDDLGTGAAYMQFSDDLEIWSEWEPYNQNKLYTLPPGAGQKTIYVKLKDAAGNRSESYSTSITLLDDADVNLALYSSVTGYPQVTASYTCCGHGEDDGQKTVNGIFDFSDGAHDRWTNWSSGNSSDSLVYNFGAPKLFNQIKLYVFNDGGGVQAPSSYTVEYWNGNGWSEVPNQSKTPETPAAVSNKDGASKENTVNTVNFHAITSSQIKLTLNKGNAYVGLVEFEVFFNASQAAAEPIISAMTNLPSRYDVRLSDSDSIQTIRAAYDKLTSNQKQLVTNLLLSKLTDAESAIIELESTLADVPVLATFSNGSGNEVTIKVASPLDISYLLQRNLFQLHVNGEGVTASEAYYDLSDPSHQTIVLMFSSPVILDATSVAVDIQRGAFRTSAVHLNNAITARSIITFKQLDLTLDQLIGVDDIALIASNPERHMDVNLDGVFDGDDVKLLLSQLSSMPR